MKALYLFLVPFAVKDKSDFLSRAVENAGAATDFADWIDEMDEYEEYPTVEMGQYLPPEEYMTPHEPRRLIMKDDDWDDDSAEEQP